MTSRGGTKQSESPIASSRLDRSDTFVPPSSRTKQQQYSRSTISTTSTSSVDQSNPDYSANNPTVPTVRFAAENGNDGNKWLRKSRYSS